MIAEAISRMLPFRAAKAPTDDFWFRPVGYESTAGEAVTIERAMAVSTVFACVRLLAETIGSLPCLVYERRGEDKLRAANHPLYEVLHDEPNRWQTPQQFFEMVVAHVLLRGNFYGRIVPGARGAVDQIVPLSPEPHRMKVEQLPDKSLVYTYREDDGELDVYTQNEIYHVAGLAFNGVTGLSVLEYARNAVGLSAAQEGHGASLFKNGAMPAFWISRPDGKPWSEPARENFRKDWRGMHAGASNAHNPPILSDGMELHELGITNQDSQWIESRNYQGYEICRFFRVQPHLVGILDRSTNNNIEHQGLEFVTYTLAPWLTRISQAGRRSLLADPKRFFIEFLVDALLRGDTKSRYEAHNIAIQGGWKTRNEARRQENMNALDGLDEPLEPLNMAPAGSRTETAIEPDTEDDEPEAEAAAARPTVALLRPVIEDAAARLVAAECKMLGRRAEKAGDDRERWDQWAAGEYERHREYVREVIAPIAAALQSETTLDEIAACLMAISRGELSGRDVPAVLAAWENDKPAQVAAYLMEVL